MNLFIQNNILQLTTQICLPVTKGTNMFPGMNETTMLIGLSAFPGRSPCNDKIYELHSPKSETVLLRTLCN